MSAPRDRAWLYLKSDLLLSPFTPNALGGMQWEWWASILHLTGLREPSCYLGRIFTAHGPQKRRCQTLPSVLPHTGHVTWDQPITVLPG